MSDKVETMRIHGEISFSANQHNYSISIIEPTIVARAARSRALICARMRGGFLRCHVQCGGKASSSGQKMQGQGRRYLEERVR